MSYTTCLIVMLGGALGTLARFLLTTVAVPVSQNMPWGTILINVIGSFAIGFFGTLTLSNGRFPASENLRLFVMIGLCGGFTTFSSFSLQTFDLLQMGATGRALANMLGSIGLCLCSVWVGHALAAQLNGGAARVAQIEIEKEG